MNSKKAIRVAQLGVGYWGPNLLRNLAGCPRCEVAKVVELSPERRSYVAKQFPNVAVTDRPDDVFNDASIDAVVIATPVASHFDLCMQALAAGKHILVEKPMARTVDEVEKIAGMAAQMQRVAMVGHTFIYNSAVRYLRSIINVGELGQIRYIYCQRLNLGRVRSDVDAMWNLAPHDVSIVQYLLGDPTPLAVSRSGMDYIQRGIDDVVFMNITYPNKVLVNIHVSWLDPQRARKMVVVGSEKMAVYDDAAADKITIFDKGVDRMASLTENMDYDASGQVLFNHRTGTEYSPKINYQEPLQVEIEHFLDCIENGTECLTGTMHALRVVKILSQAKKATEIYELVSVTPEKSVERSEPAADSAPLPSR